MSLRAAIDAFDLAGYLQAKGGALRNAGREVVLDCPICGKPKLSVNVQRKTWHCWVCQRVQGVDSRGSQVIVRGAGGLLQLVELFERKTWRGAIEFVLSNQAITHVPIDRLEWSPAVQPAAALCTLDYPEFATGIDSYSDMPYLVRRGITLQDVHDFGLFWCPLGRYKNRLIFPVYEDTRLVYYQGRAMWDPVPGHRHIKALNPPRGCGVSSDQVLFNLDVASAFSRVALVEGPIDAVHVGRDAVAVFGKRLSPAQLQKLVLRGVTAIDVLFDADAHTAAIEVATKCLPYFEVRVVRLSSGDPGDHTRADLCALRSSAPRFFGGTLS